MVLIFWFSMLYRNCVYSILNLGSSVLHSMQIQHHRAGTSATVCANSFLFVVSHVTHIDYIIGQVLLAYEDVSDVCNCFTMHINCFSNQWQIQDGAFGANAPTPLLYLVDRAS